MRDVNGLVAHEMAEVINPSGRNVEGFVQSRCTSAEKRAIRECDSANNMFRAAMRVAVAPAESRDFIAQHGVGVVPQDEESEFRR